MIWMAMNHRHQRREAYVEHRVTVDPAEPTPVTPYWLSVVPCVSDPQYTVSGGGRPGSTHIRSKTFAMLKAGRIVAVGGHIHGGSHELRLTQPACDNRAIAVSDPTYAVPGDRPRRQAARERRVRQHPASHARDGDLARVPGGRQGGRARLRAGARQRGDAGKDATPRPVCVSRSRSGAAAGRRS